MRKPDNNPYRPIKAEVLEVIPETPIIKTIRFKPVETISFATGQFIELTVPGVGEGPFTPSSDPAIKETLEVSVMKVGKVTEKIHQLKAGDIVGVRGPFGHGYPLDEFKGREILVVGGGCGFAPLRSLMYALFAMRGELKNLIFRGGCKNPREFLYRKETEEWAREKELDLKLTVDEGDEEWKGQVGLVTTILDDLKMDPAAGVAVICGPPIMMRFVTAKALDLGFQEENIYLSMEKNMSCGIGKCGHCRIGIYYACLDGPVFRYDKIKDFPNIWD